MVVEGFSTGYESALALAARAHQGQVRKAGGDPYIVHVVHVSVILLRHGFSEDVVLAGLLHDVVEDQDVPLAEIEARFGPAVADMVDALTERKRAGDEERPWEIRKQEALGKLGRASAETVAVKAADVVHNAHSVARVLRREGPAIWHRFLRGPEETLWYYRSVAQIVRQRLGKHPLAQELEGAIDHLEQVVASGTAEASGL
ncbi:MAG: HD domain-containing protein [Anaerolineae bacterium]|jgi:(p)ppGpp synthase/HD superfamily hydrolase